MAHPWHDVALPDDVATSFPVVVEISKGDENEYELDKATGLIRQEPIVPAAERCLREHP